MKHHLKIIACCCFLLAYIPHIFAVIGQTTAPAAPVSTAPLIISTPTPPAAPAPAATPDKPAETHPVPTAHDEDEEEDKEKKEKETTTTTSPATPAATTPATPAPATPAVTPAATTPATPPTPSPSPAPVEAKIKQQVLVSLYIQNNFTHDAILKEITLLTPDQPTPLIKNNLKIPISASKSIYTKGSITAFDVMADNNTVQSINGIQSIKIDSDEITFTNINVGSSLNKPIIINKKNGKWVLDK